LVERIDTDLLFRWFVGLGSEDAVWDAATFTKTATRLLEGDAAARFLASVALVQDKVKGLLSSSLLGRRHLLEAWASLKSFRPKDGSGEPPTRGAMARATFMASAAQTTRTPRPPTACPSLSQRPGQRSAVVVSSATR